MFNLAVITNVVSDALPVFGSATGDRSDSVALIVSTLATIRPFALKSTGRVIGVPVVPREIRGKDVGVLDALNLNLVDLGQSVRSQDFR